jgi:hypothetical protein
MEPQQNREDILMELLDELNVLEPSAVHELGSAMIEDSFPSLCGLSYTSRPELFIRYRCSDPLHMSCTHDWLHFCVSG